MDPTASETPDEAARQRDDLRAAREGDAAAGRRLLARHGPSMLRTAWRVLGSYGEREAEDVVQEALVAAWTTTALPRGDVGAWLRAITVRKALDEVRRRRRRAEEPIGQADTGGPEPVVDPSASRVDVLAVRRALQALSARDRAVLTLVDLEGWSMAEAAEVLGVSGVAVRLRAVRARRKLARRLRARGAAGGERETGST